ncbi:MAG: histidine--tRNA ligase [Chitinophagales bacterium]
MKPSLPQGTRDFGAEELQKRYFIMDTIRAVYEKYGFQPLETPTMENLSTLTGKYGDEGDQLLFRIMNQGRKVEKANVKAFEEKDYGKFVASLCERGLRYDLTVPFARYVVMNQHNLAFPYKRYQIQPVWRGDRPQKGRYREFYQCDADVIGSESLLNEVELTQILDEVYTKLGVNVEIRLNNRKVLIGIAEVIGAADKFMDITIAIDKLDKIGIEGVAKELLSRGISQEAIDKIKIFLDTTGSNADKMAVLEQGLADSPVGCKGVEELKTVLGYLNKLDFQQEVVLDITLARGLNYYTGTIYEVKAKDAQMGSISGGGRYDDLTGNFGLKGMSGVGISFGLDRIYDVMEELGLFENLATNTTKVLFINFGGTSEEYAFQLLQKFRQANIASELFPDDVKMVKQMKYANAKNIPFVVFVGEEEMEASSLKLKNMESGEQNSMSLNEAIAIIRGQNLK